MWLYAVTIFLSAFLLFQVQPLLAKAILPWFGGTPAVWTTCMLFFQTLLLAGYAYAFWLARQRPVIQRRLHLVLLAGALFFLKILPGAHWRPQGDEDPALRILLLLAVNIGIPYFVLSATGPLLQAWFRGRFPGRSPYRLYALSNAGSLLALLSYPFGFEPWLSVSAQATGWAVLFLVFALVCGLCAWRAAAGKVTVAETGQEPLPGWSTRWLWIAFPACSSVLLLATTNQLSQDVSVVPFLWVLPLSLYLLSFILCFDSERWYRRGLWLAQWPLAAAGVCVALFWGVDMPLRWQVLAHTAGLFIGCMVCHGELVRYRPAPRHLTTFYLCIAAGGALGGLLVSVVAPATLPDLWEYQGVWVAMGGLILWVLWRTRAWWALGVGSILFAALVVGLVWQVRRTRENQIASTRNFYGVLRIQTAHYEGEDWPSKRLLHGRITHGMQFTDGEYQWQPISYYSPATGVGFAVGALPAGPRRIGVVGLGAGIMAAWGRLQDSIRFYEINPDVVKLADSHFTYRDATLAGVVTVMGDARLTLEREVAEPATEPLDLLVLDAFSSDSIPLHLLTREAFQLYARRLRPGGILAVHISNRFLRLEGLVRGLAEATGREAVLITNERESANGTDASSWILVTNDAALLLSPAIAAHKSEWSDHDVPLVFTDTRCNLFQLLR